MPLLHISAGYELQKPAGNTKAVLMLFGGFPENATDIKREFDIVAMATAQNIAVILMNYNQKIWLAPNEKQELAEQIQVIFQSHQLPTDNVFIGGFSSGGNVSLLISDFMTQNPQYGIIPKGVFAGDSPIDLAELYRSSEKNVARNFSEPAVQESTWILETLGKQFGNPNESIDLYEKNAVFTLQTRNIDNLKNLKQTQIRLYTEPDSLWWKENRMADFEQTNAYLFKKLAETLVRQNFEAVEYIATKNKGYRANGERHPHSWAIIDKAALMDWILK